MTQETQTIEPGDIVTFTEHKTFPMEREQEYRGVVEHVEGDDIDLGIDGGISRDRITEVHGKSPSWDGD